MGNFLGYKQDGFQAPRNKLDKGPRLRKTQNCGYRANALELCMFMQGARLCDRPIEYGPPLPVPIPFLLMNVQSSGVKKYQGGRSHTFSPKLRNLLPTTAECRDGGEASSTSYRALVQLHLSAGRACYQKGAAMLWGSKYAWLQLKPLLCPSQLDGVSAFSSEN